MGKLSPLTIAKRAAKSNPAFKAAKVYATAQEGGAPLYTAAGELQYDAAETTLGYVDRSRETVLTLGPSYVGSHLVTVLAGIVPNGAALILMDGAFYQINSVHSSNVLATLITYDCTSLSTTDDPVIRNA